LAKVAAQCSADTFLVNQKLVLRINPPRRMVKIATFAKPETAVSCHAKKTDIIKPDRTLYIKRLPRNK
jgi:hypothetical protein